MKKKMISMILSIAMMATFLTGCGNQAAEDSSGDKTVIRMTYWNEKETVATLIDYLAEAVPDVEIEFQFIENSDYDENVNKQLSKGKGPDIICESPASALRHAKKGYLEPLDDLASKYAGAGTNVYNYEENIYALPGISWFEGIYFNRELFEKNKIALPTTFDEYIAVCKQLKELGITPLAAGLQSWEPMLKSSMAFVSAEYLSTNEGRIFGHDYREEKVTMDGTWNKYLEKWSELIHSGVYTRDMLEMDHNKALEQFAEGKAAMFCSGPWDLEAIKAKNPGLVIDMMPFYGTNKSAGWLIGGPGCGFAVNKKSRNKEAAIKVLEAISTTEGQAALWEDNKGGSSYLKGVVFELPQEYTSVATTLEVGNVYCPWNEWGEAAAAHKDYGMEMQNYFSGKQDLSTTLQNVDEAVNKLLK